MRKSIEWLFSLLGMVISFLYLAFILNPIQVLSMLSTRSTRSSAH